MIQKGEGVQVIYGPKVSVIKSNLEDYIDAGAPEVAGMAEVKSEETTTTTTTNAEVVMFKNPIKGSVASITEAPDAAFSEKMMGDGVVIIPEDNAVYAPCDAEVTFVFPTKHAIGLTAEGGLELLIHVGLDTVKLEGNGFNVLVNDGDKVKQGDKLMEFDLEYIRQNATSVATPFIITNLGDGQEINLTKTGESQVGDEIFTVK